MQSAAADPGTALELETPLRELFGFSRFLPGQEEIVRRTLAGRDTLALMPTGSGKSLPYQLVAMLLEAPTLVVSPLIALMKDQVDKLPPPVAERTAFVNSSLDPAEASRRLEAFAAGRVKLLYAAPERLRQRSFVSALAAAGVGLVVVDEVHCVSMWGHDFRPDYLFIQTALDRLGSPPVLGLTATATPETEREIGNSLARAFDVVRASVVRPNLHHAVEHVEDEEARRRALLERVGAETGPAIVYARSRKKCEQLSRLLQGHGFEALHYHAGLTSPERTRVQEAFLAGEARIVVATTAFGMGIDKPDIRLVLLYNLPGSLEDYVQMVGRAGRDGAASRCVLFAGQRDAADLRRFARSDLPSAHVLRGVYRTLRAHAQGDVARVDAATIEHGAGLEAGDDPRVLVGILEQSGLVRRGFDEGRVWHVELPEPPADVAARMALLLERMEHGAGLRVEGIVRYAGAHRCRQQLVAEHFGERREEPCGTCDRCLGAEAKAEPAERRALPERPAEAIVAAVDSLRWPLGSTGLAAMLSGSVAAPPSARRSPSFGVLAGATPSGVKRWLGELVASGHLEHYESEDGFRLLRVGRRGDLPALRGSGAARGAGDSAAETELDARALALLETLRAWRRRRAGLDEVPAFVVFGDRTLRALAAGAPENRDALAAVSGIGPAKLERYGAELLELLAGGRPEAPPH